MIDDAFKPRRFDSERSQESRHQIARIRTPDPADTAVRRKQWEPAVGDAVGSSFADAPLSPAMGPLIAPVVVTAGAVVVGSLVAASAVAIAVLVLVQRKEHDWLSGVVLIGLFLVSYGLVAVFAS